MSKRSTARAPAYFADLAGGDVRRALRRTPLAILPTGSTEYHGPHGALGTDYFIAAELARRVGTALGALILPGLPYAHCPHTTRAFAGTVHVAEDTMTRLLADIVTSVFNAGVRVLLVLNCHDGHCRPIDAAGEQLVERFPGYWLLVSHVWDAWPTPRIEAAGLFSTGGGHGHGGALEISAAMAARPGTARLELARDIGHIAAPPGPVHAVYDWRARNRWAGFSGRPSEASAEKGEQVLKIASDEIVRSAKAWLKELAAGLRRNPGPGAG